MVHYSRADDAKKGKGKAIILHSTPSMRGKLGLFRETHVEHVSLTNYSEKGTLTWQVDMS